MASQPAMAGSSFISHSPPDPAPVPQAVRIVFLFFPKEQLLACSHFLSDLCIPYITSLTVQILSGGGGGGGGGCGGGGGGVSARSGAREGMCDDFAVMQGFLSA
jgi:hypothetical protein